MYDIIYSTQLSLCLYPTSCFHILDNLHGVSQVCQSHSINDLVSERENHVDIVYPFHYKDDSVVEYFEKMTDF